MNVPAAALDRVIEVLPAMKKPTVGRLHGIDYFSIQTVVQKGLVNGLIPPLKARRRRYPRDPDNKNSAVSPHPRREYSREQA